MPSLMNRFKEMVAAHPKKLAIIGDFGSTSYAELDRDIENAAQFLTDSGLRSRQIVAVDGVNSLEYVVIYMAAVRLGVCIVPIDARLSLEEISTIADDSRPAAYVILSDDGAMAKFVIGRFGGRSTDARIWTRDNDRKVKLVTDPDAAKIVVMKNDDLVIQYSSGSTGKPKGIVLSRDNIYHKVMNWNATLEITDVDTFLCTLTLSHCYGMYVHTLAALLAGAQVYLQSLNTVTPGRIARLINEHHVTVFGSLPYIYQMMLALPPERLILSGVRYLISGSAPLAEVTAKEFKNRFGRNLNQVYGLTEIGLITFNKDPVDPMSIGWLTSNMEARVVNDLGQDCAVDEPGELIVRCTSMSRGYLDNLEDQRQMFKDGWLYTKDIVKRSEQGNFHIVGRLSQIVNVGGNKVAPVEVENVLLGHGAVSEAAVVGRRNHITTEEVVAFVVIKENVEAPTTAELFKHCADRLSTYKVPREIRIIDALPKSPLGKILKGQLFRGLCA